MAAPQCWLLNVLLTTLQKSMPTITGSAIALFKICEGKFYKQEYGIYKFVRAVSKMSMNEQCKQILQKHSADW